MQDSFIKKYKDFLRFLFIKKKNSSGAALLVVLSVVSILIPLVQGVWLETSLESTFNRQRINELQSRYNAKSAMGLSLLKLYIFKGTTHTFSESSSTVSTFIRPLLDKIWSAPVIWPFPVFEEVLESDQSELQNMTERSFVKGSYSALISPQDGLFDVNDLSSPLIPLREFTYDSLLNLLLKTLENSPPLKEKYQEDDLIKILNNLSDWTDFDNTSQNGGDERFLESGKRPLNRSFISIEEIRKTPGINEEIYQILSPYITTYGAKALNLNYAGREILQALNIPEKLVEEILFRTQVSSPSYRPFLNQKDFCEFLLKFDFSFCENLKENYETLDMLTFDYPLSFHIHSLGGYKKTFVEISALLYDLSTLSLNYQKLRDKQSYRRQTQSLSQSSFEENPKNGKNPKEKKLKIDYSYYKSLIIMYLKEKF